MSERAPRPVPPDGCVVLAGGGSGGHIAPGLAIAERLAQLAPGVRSVFACSERTIDRTMLEAAGATFTAIPAQPFGLRPDALWRFVRSVPKARAVATEVMAQRQPAWVVSLGGFVSAPIASAARRAGVPVLLANLDAVAGRANRWVSRRATVVVSAVPTTGLAVEPRAIVGVPLRRSTAPLLDQPESRRAFGLTGETRTLFVTGASQGAGSINRFLAAFANADDRPLAGWQVIHQCGPRGDDVGVLEAAYRAAGVPAAVVPFIDRMGLAWGAADVALARAGANLVWEARQARVPTIFAPYPWHKDLHQRANAEELVSAGGAIVALDQIDAEANQATLGAALRVVLGSPKRLTDMREALAGLPTVDAADRIAAWLLGRCGW